MEKKGTLTPEEGIQASVSGQNAPARTRRTDARRGVSEKITIRALAEPSQSQGQAPGEGDIISTGWAINISRSGVRAILEERVLAGVDYAVTVGEDGTSQLTRRARVVWVQEEHDGVVVGLEFASQSGMHKAAPGAVPGDSVPADAVPEDASPEGAGEEKGDGENT